jgi:lipopolysaccharide/colanic/teichoic acid biosynthesis glycosyltransferase
VPRALGVFMHMEERAVQVNVRAGLQSRNDGVRGRAAPGGAPASAAVATAASAVYPRFIKPAVDFSVALVGLVLALPILIVVACAIRISMGPGVFFVQERVGRFGRPFKMYKFRTMDHCRRRGDARSSWEGQDRRCTHKSDCDPRHTTLGRVLRKWSLDELPQLFNVLRGDMSLVGPRPELVSVVDAYAPWQHERHQVRPGLTGLWQITSRGDGTLMKEHVDIDLRYVATVSLRTDARIIVRTVPALIGARGT